MGAERETNRAYEDALVFFEACDNQDYQQGVDAIRNYVSALTTALHQAERERDEARAAAKRCERCIEPCARCGWPPDFIGRVDNDLRLKCGIMCGEISSPEIVIQKAIADWNAAQRRARGERP